jgi:hypothetical protein
VVLVVVVVCGVTGRVVVAAVGIVVLVVVLCGPRAHVDSAPPSQLHRPSLQDAGMSLVTPFLHRRLALPCKPAHVFLMVVAMAARQRWRLHGLPAAPAVQPMAAIPMASQIVVRVPRAGMVSIDSQAACQEAERAAT